MSLGFHLIASEDRPNEVALDRSFPSTFSLAALQALLELGLPCAMQGCSHTTSPGSWGAIADKCLQTHARASGLGAEAASSVT